MIVSQVRISIHALLAESDKAYSKIIFFALYFYPRSPCGERQYCSVAWLDYSHFYPRSPCGERQLQGFLLAQGHNFYPRSPCGERLKNPEAVSKYMIFLSTLSLRRATPIDVPQYQILDISIHALLAESDYILVNTFLTIFEFLSTLSLRRATLWVWMGGLSCDYFYPRSPCGERQPLWPSY